MIEVHIRQLEAILRAKLSVKELKTVDYWNNQLHNFGKAEQFLPGVLFDFGNIKWQPMVGDIFQQGKCNITAHCINYDYRQTRDKANDADGQRLKRFTWSETIMNILNGTAARDRAGNTMFNRLQLIDSLCDTNHDAMYDDVLMFECQIFYYKAWRERHWKEIILADVDVLNDMLVDDNDAPLADNSGQVLIS